MLLLFPHVVGLQHRIYNQDVLAIVFYTSSHRDMSIVRECAPTAAAAAVVLYSMRSFPHRHWCLPSLLLQLFTWYAVGGVVVAVPARSRPLAIYPTQKTYNVP